MLREENVVARVVKRVTQLLLKKVGCIKCRAKLNKLKVVLTQCRAENCSKMVEFYSIKLA